MIAAIVAPAGARSMSTMRACLVIDRAARFDEAGWGRLREADVRVVRTVERDEVFGWDLGLVMGSSEVCAAPSAAPPQPRLGKRPAGQDLKTRFGGSKSPRSNAPIDHESQSFLSKLIAH
jgi:hypothetical protein